MAVCWIHSRRWRAFEPTLDAYRTSSWLDPGLSGGGAFPPLNVFRKATTSSSLPSFRG